MAGWAAILRGAQAQSGMRHNQCWHGFRESSNCLRLWVRDRGTDTEKVKRKMSVWSNGSAGVMTLRLCVCVCLCFFIYSFKMVEGHRAGGQMAVAQFPTQSIEQCSREPRSITCSSFITLSLGFLTYIACAHTSWSIFKAAVSLGSIFIKKESRHCVGIIMH